MAEFTADNIPPAPPLTDFRESGTERQDRWTRETWFNGGLTLWQPRKGYRYTIDPLILCSQIFPASKAHILDMGCGCGIMPLILGVRYPTVRITGVELQQELAEAAQKNIIENRMNRHIRILQTDIRTLTPEDTGRPADLILSNPPYKKAGTGRINPHRGRALARHEICLTIAQLFEAAAPLLSPDGRICLIFPADRLSDLEAAAAAAGFTPDQLRFVHHSREKPPFRAVVSAVTNSVVSRRVLPPLVLYRKDGSPTKAHTALFNP